MIRHLRREKRRREEGERTRVQDNDRRRRPEDSGRRNTSHCCVRLEAVAIFTAGAMGAGLVDQPQRERKRGREANAGTPLSYKYTTAGECEGKPKVDGVPNTFDNSTTGTTATHAHSGCSCVGKRFIYPSVLYLGALYSC